MSPASSSPAQHCATGYELRFAGLFNPGHGYAFPCDAEGCVDIDSLGQVARANYFYARTVIGREFRNPVTRVLDPN
jgi:hypothetical protein